MKPATTNDDHTAKVCTDCSVMKSLDNFYDQKFGLLGLGSRCKACLSARHKARRSGDGFKARERIMAACRQYGITLTEYDVLYEDPTCRACKRPEVPGKRLHIDHDHETGEVRGLLCRNCNVALGHLEDDPARIAGLLEYVRSFTDAEWTASGLVAAG